MADLVFKAFASDDEQRNVFGLASLSLDADGQALVDLQNDVIPPAELEKAFYDYVSDPDRAGGDADHDRVDKSTLIESFVVTPTKLSLLLRACGYEGVLPTFKGCAAWVGYHVDDPQTWARVKSQELKAFSVEIEAEREAA